MSKTAFALIAIAMIFGAAKAYDEDLAKTLMTYSALSYCAESDLQEASCTNCYSMSNGDSEFVHQFSQTNSIVKDSVSYSAFVDSANERLIFAFRGTNTKTQLVQEAVEGGAVSYDLHSISGAYVLKFFYNSYVDNLRSDFLSTFESYHSDHSSYDVIITGHSLGGALATHAALDLVLSGKISSWNLKLYTFGSPRVGTYDFAQKVESTLGDMFRVVHYKDAVPHVPFCKIENGECSIGEDYDGSGLTWPAYHVSPQIFYNDAQTSYEICGAEDMDCANQFSGLSFSVGDHLDYFNIKNGCDH